MWKDRIEQLESLRRQAKLGGGEARMEKQHSSGRLTARERIDLLLDPGSFVEMNRFAESRCTDPSLADRCAPGDGVVTGYGTIDGRNVCVAAEDFTVIGGTLGEVHGEKICRIMDLAVSTGAAFICIYDSGGARIEEGIASLNAYAEIFRRHTMASGVIPQIAVIAGPCCGGACYGPALCDFIFMVDRIGKMFITGPKVVKAALSQQVTAEELGGASIHANVSGVTHFTYEDEVSCLNGVKKLLSYLPKTGHSPAPLEFAGAGSPGEALYDIVPDHPKRGYDMHKVICAVADRNSVMEVQQDFAKNVIVCFARMEGAAVGVVANQPSVLAGSLDCDSADKAARFVRFCSCNGIPVLTFVDVSAFLPGMEQEGKGIIRHGAKLLYAYAEAAVPKITVVLRKAFGGAYIAMDSKGLGADVVLAWPSAQISVMGAEGAAEILAGKQADGNDAQEARRRLTEQYEQTYMNPMIAVKRGYVDDLILPEETREKICAALRLLKTKKANTRGAVHGNIPL